MRQGILSLYFCKFLALAVIGISLAACSAPFSSKGSSSRNNFFSAQAVFKDTLENQERERTPEEMPPTQDHENPGGGDEEDDNEDGKDSDSLKVDVRRKCSDKYSKKLSNVQSASSVFMALYKKNSNEQVCISTQDYKDALKNYSQLDLAFDCDLEDGSYELYFYDTGFVTDISRSKLKDKALGDLDFKVKNGKIQDKKEKIEVIYATNPKQDDLDNRDGEDYENCDKFASPLAIKLNSLPGSLTLSSPDEGTRFDIMGDLDPVMPHFKRQISWPTGGLVGFVALPNSVGEVWGIDELFGDNTRGPDGLYAAHGYEALAKHDLNQDGVINSKDPVFSKLRIWVDYNRDGRSTRSELHTLREVDLVALDLNYDANYYEQDRYGNEILYKSVATLGSGRDLLMFDIWFRLTE